MMRLLTWESIAMAEPLTPRLAAGNQSFPRKGGVTLGCDRGKLNCSSPLRCELALLRDLRHFDPRASSGMPEAMHQLAVRLLPEVWSPRCSEVNQKAAVVKGAPGFPAEVTAADTDGAAFLASIAALSVAAKVALLHHAVGRQAHAAVTAARGVVYGWWRLSGQRR
jgi:hypothetical protein